MRGMNSRQPSRFKNRFWFCNWQAGIAAMFLTFFGCVGAQAAEWNETEVSYGPEERQWMNIALPETDELAGIVFWAHANGGSPYNLSQDSANAMLENGYAIVAWASIERLQNPADIETGWADAQLVFDYVRENAATWNLDPNNVVISGRSRGSIVSWKLAHSAHPAIRGIYMYNALPSSVWEDGNESWVDDVTAESPTTYLVFGPPWGDKNSHRPDNVIPIREQYEELGIGDRFTLYQDMWGDFTDEYGRWNNEYRESHYFPEFVAALSRPVVSSVTMNGGGVQRSAVESIAIAFDGEVDFKPDAFTVIQRNTKSGESFETVEIQFDTQFEDGVTVATIEFLSHTRPSTNALEDGNYQFTLTADLVARNGQSMVEDYVFGDEESEAFFSFYGDSNGDRKIDYMDAFAFQQAFMTFAGHPNYDYALDYNANGFIGLLDLNEFRNRFLDSMPFKN